MILRVNSDYLPIQHLATDELCLSVVNNLLQDCTVSQPSWHAVYQVQSKVYLGLGVKIVLKMIGNK
jgi:hypothetical protein